VLVLPLVLLALALALELFTRVKPTPQKQQKQQVCVLFVGKLELQPHRTKQRPQFCFPVLSREGHSSCSIKAHLQGIG
jgi:hypothetical protein